MCLIVVGWRTHSDFPLIVAANRDEFYARPTAFASVWPAHEKVLGGRDLEAGGTWLGINAEGRFAAVTNVREPGVAPGPRSRGHLTRDYLLGKQTPEEFIATLGFDQYSGFNLLLGDKASLWYCTNRGLPPRPLEPGVYGVSNHLLDSPWPKLLTARTRFADAMAALPDRSALFELLADDEIVPDEELPATGVTLEWERRLSAIFVRSESYGTRASTVVVESASGDTVLEERSFGSNGVPLHSSVITTSV